MGYDNLFIDSELLKPLSQKDLYDYFMKYKSGDMIARDMIIKSNIRLVINQVLRKYNNTQYDKSELISVGLIGLIKSVDHFDISKQVSFSTYALKCIDNEILLFMRKGKKYISNISLDDILGNDINDNQIKREDLLCDDSFDLVLDYEKKELCFKIRELVDVLPDRKRDIIYLYFGFDGNASLTQKEISVRLNIAQPTVSKTISEVLRKISSQLSKEGLIQNKDIKVRKRK